MEVVILILKVILVAPIVFLLVVGIGIIWYLSLMFSWEVIKTILKKYGNTTDRNR